ncbi:ArsR/SmtB family transcription factor [Phosphitispora fastidiosa]|uniref:ArsR/SmtB family transcription factor n=1 Tax=Phosphitispora fastidiosa TaxID=2837202 RepID=UPI001E5D661F|nr:metalloregulator ArsR/SmtB family transcription factor [Phosphitispora fastidiosa]MBU7008081.1 DNA-binding transcriptional ArsR family regulator [Phosphitispora fastidiosa]
MRLWGDEVRLKILQMLTEREMCVCEIIDWLDMSQPVVSHHLKILRQAGLVKDCRDGKWIYYSLNENPGRLLLF